MLKLLRFAAPALLGMAVVPSISHAQATVNSGGKLSIQFSNQVIKGIDEQNIGVLYEGAGPIRHGEEFLVTGGSVKLNTGVGDVETIGSVTFTEGSDSVTLGQLDLLATKTNSYITAEVYVGDQDMGRYPVFLLDSNLFAPPLTTGKYNSGQVGFSINPVFQSEYGDYLPIANLDPTAVLGNFTLKVTISRNR